VLCGRGLGLGLGLRLALRLAASVAAMKLGLLFTSAPSLPPGGGRRYGLLPAADAGELRNWDSRWLTTAWSGPWGLCRLPPVVCLLIPPCVPALLLPVLSARCRPAGPLDRLCSRDAAEAATRAPLLRGVDGAGDGLAGGFGLWF